MKPITICFTYFRSLQLSNLSAALYSVGKQDLSNVEQIVILDNNTDDSIEDIQYAIPIFSEYQPYTFLSEKHRDSSKTHPWSTNTVVRHAKTPWVLFCRADYLLDFDLLRKFWSVVCSNPRDWNGFVTGNVFHLSVDIGKCEQTDWRDLGVSTLQRFPGKEESYTCIDAGVWMLRKSAFEEVGGLDESLFFWGHAQTHFQYKLWKSGVDFVRIPEILFYHPQHSAQRDIDLAHWQLRDHGIDIKELWSRYEGAKPY